MRSFPPRSVSAPASALARAFVIATLPIVAVALTGCGVPRDSLMVAPVIYGEEGVDPLANTDPSHRSPHESIYFVTNRERDAGTFDQPLAYGNVPSSTLQIGTARVRFGDDVTWEELHAATRSADRERDIKLRLSDVWEYGSVHFNGHDRVVDPTDGWNQFLADINAELAVADHPEIVIYVHGAKVNFYHACIYAAQIDHFAGRDVVAIAFAWPTHQDIFRYLTGEDVARGRDSVELFESMLRLLATETKARRINIICWSAGGRLVSKALDNIGQWEDSLRSPTGEPRLGAVVFAAPDVPAAEFFERLPAIHRAAERVIITASDDDIALSKATLFMGRGRRMGTSLASMPDADRAMLEKHERVEFVDVSSGRDERGFNIDGHRYWYMHPWVASDLILSIRTRKPADQRGLASTDVTNVWSFPPDYPDRANAAARGAFGGEW